MRSGKRKILTLLTCISGAMLLPASMAAAATPIPYQVITPTKQAETVTVTGHDLTIEQVVAVARDGARIEISPEGRKRAQAAFNLLLQAQEQGVPVYRFNRGAGSRRQVVTLKGKPGSAEFRAAMDARHADPESAVGQSGAAGFGDDMAMEEVGRAMLVVTANNVTFEAVSPAFVQGVVDLLNAGVTPAVYWRGAIGEADFVPIGSVLNGQSFAYYKGEKLPAREALRRAGLKPIQFDGNDEALNTTSTLTAGYSALLVHDTRQVLEWHDLIYAMELLGMNSSTTPMALPTRATRPFAWPAFTSARVLEMVKGSYIFDADPNRIIQDPESMRATPWRAGGAWQAWARLRDATLVQMNSTDHNPTARPGFKPGDSWELATPYYQELYIRPGKYSPEGGFIFSNSNWDPYPLANDIEALAPSLANLAVAVVNRIHRFESPFFTGVDAAKALPNSTSTGSPLPRLFGTPGGGGGGGVVDALWQEMKPLINPLAPDGVVADAGVGDLDAVPMLKLVRAYQAIDVMRDILGQDLLNATYWMDVRRAAQPTARFSTPTEAVWQDFRHTVPLRLPDGQKPELTSGTLAANFLKTRRADEFFSGGPALPATLPIPRAERPATNP
jgi:histidine ammonia-lyase